jgi:3alpha(or 20beta)-hydroxysteroid dehydrogenase
MTQSMAGKVVIISGGARGIGAEVVRQLVRDGAYVLIGDVLEAEGKAFADSLGESVRFTPLDVRRDDSWQSALAVCLDEFGPPDVLINNAGVMVAAPIEFSSEDQFRHAFEVNMLGPYLGTKTVLSAMRDNGGGSIVIVTSAAGLEGTPGLPLYSASKAGNANFARTAAMELGQYKIRVNAIAPGLTNTPMSNGPDFAGWDKSPWLRQLPIPREGEVDDIAPAILFLASDASKYMTGSLIVVDGGQLAGHVAL